MGVTARVPRRAAPGKARIGEFWFTHRRSIREGQLMYLGIDFHKRYAQVAVIDDAGSRAVIEATSNYHLVDDTLAEYLDVTVVHPGKLTHIAQSDKKTDRVDAKELARLLRLNSVPKSYFPTSDIR